MKKSLAMMIFLIVLSIIIISAVAIIYIHEKEDEEQVYSISINRNFKDTDEEYALNIVENLDYPNITGFKRFNDNTNSITFDIDHLYTYYVDSYIVENCKERLEYLDRNNEIHNGYLEYSVNIERIPFTGVKINQYNQTINVNSNFYYYWLGYLYGNSSDPWNEIHENISMRFQDEGYCIEMMWCYKERYGPTSGFSTSHYQYVIIDDMFHPVALFLQYPRHTVF